MAGWNFRCTTHSIFVARQTIVPSLKLMGNGKWALTRRFRHRNRNHFMAELAQLIRPAFMISRELGSAVRAGLVTRGAIFTSGQAVGNLGRFTWLNGRRRG